MPKALPIGPHRHGAEPRDRVRPVVVIERRRTERDVSDHLVAIDGDERHSEPAGLAQRVDHARLIGATECRIIDRAQRGRVGRRLGSHLC